jgi:hypothetical protein
MKNLQQEFSLTELENEMLSVIVKSYDSEDNICFQRTLTQSEKGVIGSLVKKELVYDSCNGIEEDGNFFPSENVLEYLELN